MLLGSPRFRAEVRRNHRYNLRAITQLPVVPLASVHGICAREFGPASASWSAGASPGRLRRAPSVRGQQSHPALIQPPTCSGTAREAQAPLPIPNTLTTLSCHCCKP